MPTRRPAPSVTPAPAPPAPCPCCGRPLPPADAVICLVCRRPVCLACTGPYGHHTRACEDCRLGTF